ncbi:carbohydrate ABC transporter permease [Neobacillus sp. PS3-34]|uniref:carbohydrate ABC transporter permease n=1 Tax=Neobacillus sp. PS3-34 TaxID=3070678 RepID=UPI0027DF760F|nr:carbohydrate ABC transporter permease [Neobacillus sp. PS3-34]WML48351.1 carbohydrate ABC transporter permease [Neobacillus sp. PS3-34]
MKISRGEKTFGVFNTLLLAILALSTLYPFIYMTALSLNEGLDSLKGGIYFCARAFTWINIKTVVTNPLVQDAFFISIGRTVVGTIGTVFITGICAYALSFRKLPYRKLIMIYFLIPMLFSGGLIPYYIQLRNLGLIDSFFVYIFPGLLNIWNLIVMRSFFENIPDSLIEAAEIDGANPLTIFWRIVIPISMPMIAAISLFTAVAHWNSWFDGAYFVNDMSLKPLQTYLQNILMNADAAQNLRQGSASVSASSNAAVAAASRTITPMALKMAVVILGTLPVLIIYPLLQRYFVKGVLIGGVKE